MPLTDDQLAQLRKMIDEADDSGGWNATVLSALFDSNGADLRRTARVVWEAKAANLTDAVDTTESGSSRRMSQEFDHALQMAKVFGSSEGTDTVATAPRSTRIVRPTREV